MKNEIKEQNKIPQFRSYVDKADFRFIAKAFEKNYYAEGTYAKEFQEKLLTLIGSKFGCFACNGTLALYLALKAIGVKSGDEVIVQNITFIASANAVEMIGAKPLFADIVSYKNLTIDLNSIKVTKKTKAMVLCHLFGTACSNIEEVSKFCNKHGLLLVEDAAQALAIKSSNRHCGAFGKVGTFSFYADKTITTGEGGFVVTDDAAIYEKMLYLRNQGRKHSGTFVHQEIGYNFRITDIQACLGLSQLLKLDKIKDKKQKIHEQYKHYLGDQVEFLSLNPDFSYIPFRVVIFVKDAEKTMKYLIKNGVESRSMFYPLHKQPCYRFLGY
ncbi:MAG: aminotransferase class V-fold PLP-dependent enzyme, partial [Gammaproteobacteria bacterium]|nr:aminotransferase class V-fold PLP-dependent enzyme [Gammaproteobacteria bacterium]